MPVVEVTLSVKMTLYFTIIQFVRLLRLPLAFFTDRPRGERKKGRGLLLIIRTKYVSVYGKLL